MAKAKVTSKKKTKKKAVKKTTKKAVIKIAKPVTKVIGSTVDLKAIAAAINSNTCCLSDCIDKIQNLEKAILGQATKVKTHPATQTAAQTDFLDVTTELSVNNGAATVTTEEVRQALQEVGATAGMPRVKEILESVKAKNISDINAAQYASVIAACKTKPQTQNTQTSAISLFD